MQDERHLRARFQRWVDMHHNVIYWDCWRRVGGREELAKELLQETYQIAWKKIEEFDGTDQDARSWMFKIAELCSLGLRRKERSILDCAEEILEYISPHSSEYLDVAMLQQDIEALKRGIAQLDPIEQRLLELRHGVRADASNPKGPSGLDYTTIANIISAEFNELTVKDAVRMRVKRAILKLRQMLSEATASDRNTYSLRRK